MTDDDDAPIDAQAPRTAEARLQTADPDGAAMNEDMAENAEDGIAEDAPIEAPGPGGRLRLTAEGTAESEQLRMLEALLFAAAEPLDEETLAARLPRGADVAGLLATLEAQMQGRGVELARAAGGWRLQTPTDLAWLLEDVRPEKRKLSGAARETLAIIAYHQPATRAEVEQVRGVAVSKGTLDMLMELGWVRMRGRRRVPGRPVTYGTTDQFLAHFGLDSLSDLPGKAELKAAGLLDGRLPPDFTVPDPGLFDTRDEMPLEDEGVEESAFHVDFIGEETEDNEPRRANTV